MKNKKNKKGLKIFLGIIVAVVIISTVAFGVACAILGKGIVFGAIKNVLASPVGNFKAAWLYFTNDTSSIEEQIGETQKNFDDAIKDAIGTELSDEIKAAIDSGKYTEQEIARILSGVPIEEIDRLKEIEAEKQNEKSEEDEKTNQTELLPEINEPTIPEAVEKQDPPVEVLPPEVPEDEPIIDDTATIIAKMYIIKNKFMKKLENIEVDILNEYISYPSEERNPALRKTIAGKYISSVAELEIQCDAEVEVVLTELKEKLTALSKDLIIIDTIRKAYADEKSLKKAYYMDIYLNGLRGKPVPKASK